MSERYIVTDRPGIAPCGATFGTAAGPNNGVTPCGVCHVVHPLQIAGDALPRVVVLQVLAGACPTCGVVSARPVTTTEARDE